MNKSGWPDWKFDLFRMFETVLEFREHFPEELVGDTEMSKIGNRILHSKSNTTGDTAKIAIVYRCMYSYLVSKKVVPAIYDDPVLRSSSEWPTDYAEFMVRYSVIRQKLETE